MEKINQISELNKDELKIYQLAIARGYITASMISSSLKKVNINGLQTLAEKGFVKKINGIVDRYIPISPVRGFISKLDDFSGELEKVDTQIKDIDKNIKTTYTTLNSESDEAIKNALSGVLVSESDNINKALDSIETENQRIKSGIAETTKKIESDLESIKEPATNQFKGSSDEIINKSESEILSQVKTNSDTLNTLIDSIKKSLDQYKSDISKDIDGNKKEFGKQIKTIKSDIKSKISSVGDNAVKSYNDMLNIIKNDVQGTTDNASKSIKSAEEFSKNTIISVKDEISTVFSDSNQKLNDVMANSHKIIENSKDSLISSLKSSNEALNSGIETSINELVSDTSTNVSQLKSDLTSKSDQVFSTSVGTIKSKNSEWESKISEMIIKGIDIMRDGGSALKTVIVDSIQNEVQRYKDEVAAALAKVQEEYLKRIDEAGKIYEVSLKNEINDKVVDYSDLLKKTSEELKTTSSQMITEQEKSITELKSDANSKIVEINDKIDSTYKEILVSKFNSTKESIDSTFKENIELEDSKISESMNIIAENQKLISDNIISTQEKVNSSLETESAKLLKDVDTRINTLQETTKNAIVSKSQETENSINNITADINGNIEIVNQSLDNASNALGVISDKFIGTFSPTFDSIPKQVKDAYSPAVEKINTILNTLKSSFLDASSKIQESYFEQIKKGTIDLKGEITNYEKRIIDALDKSKGLINSAFENLTNLAKTASGNIETTIKATIEKIKTSMLNKVTGFAGELSSIIASGKDMTNTPKNMLKGVWEEFVLENVWADSEKTWIMVTQDVILDYINQSVPELKSSGFIMVPKPTDIDWKSIMKTHEKGRKFFIVSDLTLGDRKMLKKAFDSGIELYNYSGKDFIAFTKDKEEILIAPVAPEEDETTAIVSELSPMIEHMSGMFSDFWRRVAKKYVPE